MNFFLEEGKVPIAYDPIFRKYSIDLRDAILQAEFSPTQEIVFCPWCGSHLPAALDNKFWEILENDLKIHTNVFEFLEDTNVPPEFKTDEWWKKRNL